MIKEEFGLNSSASVTILNVAEAQHLEGGAGVCNAGENSTSAVTPSHLSPPLDTGSRTDWDD